MPAIEFTVKSLSSYMKERLVTIANLEDPDSKIEVATELFGFLSNNFIKIVDAFDGNAGFFTAVYRKCQIFLHDEDLADAKELHAYCQTLIGQIYVSSIINHHRCVCQACEVRRAENNGLAG